MMIRRRLSEIQRADPKTSIAHFPDSVSRGRTQRNILSGKGPADEDSASLETDRFAADSTNDVSRRVAQLRQCLREGAQAHLVARNRNRHPNRLVRTLAVVHLAPLIKGRLTIAERAESMISQQFLTERAMKAFVLALGAADVAGASA